jgi:hypothetical protein
MRVCLCVSRSGCMLDVWVLLCMWLDLYTLAGCLLVLRPVGRVQKGSSICTCGCGEMECLLVLSLGKAWAGGGVFMFLQFAALCCHVCVASAHA